MTKLSTAIIVAIFIVVLLGVNGEEKARNKRQTVTVVSGSNVLDWLCQNNLWASYFTSWCNTITTTTTPKPLTTKGTGGSTTSASTSSPTPLQNAHWCQLGNGTYLTNGQTYLQMACLLCQCKQTRDIVCKTLPCMPTYCIDGTNATIKAGNCCPTCSYETQAVSCNVGGTTFPHGTLITNGANNSQCWCQQGSIECRRALAVTTTTTTTWEYFGSGTAVYIIVIVICLVLVLGSILCCGCALLYYYYYQNQQQSIQQAYEQYYNNAGWQPMGEEGQFGDAAAEEKKSRS